MQPPTDASNVKLKLTYLQMKGFGEMLRLALFHGGLEFEDERISYEEVQRRRSEGLLPCGQVPVLEIDGVAHSQSMALLRWIGMRTGLFPVEHQLKIDAIHEAFADINKNLFPNWYGHILGRSPVDGALLVPMTDDQKSQTLELLNTVVLPCRLQRIEATYTSAGNDFFCGSAPTTADFQWYVMGSGLVEGTYCEGVSTQILDQCPNLRRIIENVAKLPRVVEWNAAHPE